MTGASVGRGFDARDYVAWLAKRTGEPYRLPSEAEWEYAARGGTTSGYFWGSDANTGAPACEFANVYDESGRKANTFDWDPFGCDDGFGRAAPVGSFEPNPFGLHDMIGTVWEWNADCYEAPFPPQPLPRAPRHHSAASRAARQTVLLWRLRSPPSMKPGPP